MSDQLTWATRDSKGYAPETSLLGRKYKHSGNGHVYTLIGFLWHGDTDEWLVCYEREGCAVNFTRTVHNWKGWRQGAPRFELQEE